MAKKVKIKELHEEPDFSGQKGQDLTRISIDDLSTETNIEVPSLNETAPVDTQQIPNVPPKPTSAAPKETQKQERPTVDVPRPKKNIVETRVEIISDQVSFKRNTLYSFIFKGLSYAVILLVLDVTLHFLKFLDGKEVLKLEYFDSFIFTDDQFMNLVKVILFFSVVHWTTPKGNIVVNRRGIICQHIKVMNLFFTSANVFLSWDEIKVVKYKIRFFEPYLFFYGPNDEELGQLDFAIESKKEFFKFVEKNAGKNHPIITIQKEMSLF